MADSNTTVVRVANSPDQAKVFVALLQGAGIPARVDGDGLVDEFVTSQRLMNQVGVKVYVPTASLAQARDVLADVDIEADELERQALAAERPESAAAVTATPAAARASRWPLVVASGLAVLFFALWMGKLEEAKAAEDPLFDYRPEGDSLQKIRRADGKLVGRYTYGHTGIVERMDDYDASGELLSSAYDDDGNGYFEKVVIRRDGRNEIWTDEDGDGVHDRCVVQEADGKVVQRLEWRGREGYVVERP